jgi:hypothetical protein
MHQKAAGRRVRPQQVLNAVAELDVAVACDFDGGLPLAFIDVGYEVVESGEPMTTKQMVEAMATKGYWTSPAGATPHATLYSALLREFNAKGKDARFVKTEHGKFAAKK